MISGAGFSFDGSARSFRGGHIFRHPLTFVQLAFNPVRIRITHRTVVADGQPAFHRNGGEVFGVPVFKHIATNDGNAVQSTVVDHGGSTGLGAVAFATFVVKRSEVNGESADETKVLNRHDE